jgi:hypothetical protein
MITSKPSRGDNCVDIGQFTDMMNRWMEDVTDALDSVPKTNYSALINPAVTDDAKAGYAAGSEWLNTTTNTFFRCTDATNGAAVWV